jgi:hypothetical protein
MAKKRATKKFDRETATPAEWMDKAILGIRKMKLNGSPAKLTRDEASAIFATSLGACAMGSDMTAEQIQESYNRLNTLYDMVRTQREQVLVALANAR